MKRTIAGLLMLALSSQAFGAGQAVEGSGSGPGNERPTDKRGAANTALFGNIYSRPAYRQLGRNVYLGGYVDFEYKIFDDKAFNTMRTHRLIPFIYADVTDQIKFATEIELEYGGPQNPQKDGEIKVEFATLDYQFEEAFGFRGGLLLVPMGRVNALHDSPLQDTTDRAVVASALLPSTWTEAGMGFLGTFYPGETGRLDYEVYLVNGLASSGAVTAVSGGVTVVVERADFSQGFRAMRGFQKDDNNRNVAVVGRVGYSPFLGLEFGASAYHGNYNKAGDLGINLQALDFAFQEGPFEILGEGAIAQIQQDTATPIKVAYVNPTNRMEGYYGQMNYHFGHNLLAEGSVFTGVLRWDDVNLSGALGQGTTDTQRLTAGINFRPVEGTVFKVDYQVNFEDGMPDAKINNGWNFGFASYF